MKSLRISLGGPHWRFHRFELAVEINVLPIDQNRRGITINGRVARRDLHGQPAVRPVAKLPMGY